MVRLEGPIPALPAPALTDFNSTMVRLEVIDQTGRLTVPIDFNSTMVRLEVNNYELTRQGKQNFNSIMVRLEESPDTSSFIEFYISIPLWYDWKLLTRPAA